MSESPKIAIGAADWEIVRGILQLYVPNFEVWAFGSRARWTSKEYSDLDLAIISSSPLGLDRTSALSAAFSESSLPFKVDFVEWSSTRAAFRKIIEKDKVVIQEPTTRHEGINTSDWSVKQIGEVASIFDGPHATPRKTAVGPVFLGISSLDNGRLNLNETEHLSEEDFEKWTRRVVPKGGDIVFSYETRLGQAAIIPESLRCCLGRRLALVRPSQDKLDSRYFLYYFLSPNFQDFLRARTIQGSTVDRIPLKEFPLYEIPVPPMGVQKAVANLLSAFDEKIALLHEINATLEATTQAIFKSWFLDFDPVRAKAEGRDPEGVPPEVVDLFPSEFEESELGAIPKGWRVDSLEQHLDVVRGLSYKGSGLTTADDPEGVPMHNLNSVREGGGYKYEGLKFYKGDHKPKHQVKTGDIVVANTEQGHKHLLIGYPALIPSDHGASGIFSHHLYRIRVVPSSPLRNAFTYRLLMAPGVREQVIGCSNGTTVNMLKADGLAMPRFACPPKQLIDAFEQTATAIGARQEESVTEANSLTSLRDTLLPRLMSGKLRVPDAQEVQA